MADAPPLVLSRFPPAFGLPISESPPAAKVALYLRLTKTPHTLAVGSTLSSPNGMVPYVRWPDGRLQAESGDIIADLEVRCGLDRGVAPAALDRGRRLAEQVELTCYDACLHDRFTLADGWRVQKPVTAAYVAHLLPSVLVPLALPWVRWKQMRRAARQTMADPAAGHAASIAVIESISACLRDQSFVCGDRPSTVDCAIWPNLLHVAATCNPTPPREAVRSSRLLVDWIERLAGLADYTLGQAWKGRS